jgi:hypothetical protein
MCNKELEQELERDSLDFQMRMQVSDCGEESLVVGGVFFTGGRRYMAGRLAWRTACAGQWPGVQAHARVGNMQGSGLACRLTRWAGDMQGSRSRRREASRVGTTQLVLVETDIPRP